MYFYTQVLGFTCGEYNEEWGWASLHFASVELMISKPVTKEGFEKPTFTGSLYFGVEDVDAYWNKLKGKAKICYEVENFAWGMREFAIYDNNGYILQFGQLIKH